MEVVTSNNKTYLSLRNGFGKIEPFQLQIYAKSGEGKGLAEEYFITEWRKQTKGIVLVIADPKEEAEFSYVQYLPEERYHTQRLKLDGIQPQNFRCKIYHPFTFGLQKGYLPPINFFSIPIKEMTREDWSILTESSWDSESIKLMLRVAKELHREDGLFQFLHKIQSLIEGKKRGKENVADPRNFYLKVSGGTGKSLVEIAGLLNFFKQDYFLRKENCPHKLDWKEILQDNENYHVFLSMWLSDKKLKHFMVLHLLKQIIKNRGYAKKPILIVIPEIRVLCKRNSQGYPLFLALAIVEALSSMRSQGRGISSITDSQNWLDTDDGIKGSATITLFGNLSTKDQEMVVKAMGYKREFREQLQNMEYRNSYLIAGKESDGAMRSFLPPHMHCEPEYEWIEMYKKKQSEFNLPEMKRYDDLVSYMREEYDYEEKEIKEMVQIEADRIKEEKRKKDIEREIKKAEKKADSKTEETEDKNKEVLMKLCFEMYHDERLTKKERSYRGIGRKLKLNHVTVQKYVKKYKEIERKKNELPDLKPVGDLEQQEDNPP